MERTYVLVGEDSANGGCQPLCTSPCGASREELVVVICESQWLCKGCELNTQFKKYILNVMLLMAFGHYKFYVFN